MSTDLLLERITASSGMSGYAIGKIPFPDALRPIPAHDFKPAVGLPLPAAEVVVVCYTAAESEATADVLTPGVHRTDWVPYTHNWDLYEPQLTGRSPARDSKCMGWYWPTSINGHDVLVLHSNLHLATDGKSLPVAQMLQQAATETGCSLMIDTGTAGGVGASEVLGDVVFSAAVKSNMAKSQFEDEPWAQQRFPATALQGYNQPVEVELAFSTLIPAAIGDSLKPSGYASRAPQAIFGKDVETVGYFAFADTADSYGVVKNDPDAGVEEMDAAAMCVGLARMQSPPRWISIRNASDPQMGGGSLQSQKSAAAKIYQDYGYFTTVCSGLGCWAVIAGM